MKLITARISPYRLDSVHAALVSLGIENMMATDIKYFNKTMSHTEVHRGHTYSVQFMPMVKIEAVIADDMIKTVVDTLYKTANLERSEGDGASSEGDGANSTVLVSDLL